MIDRFDLIIEVPEVTADLLLAPTANEPSHVIAQRVEAARAYAATRHNQGADCINARFQSDQLADIINFDEDAALLLKTAVESHTCPPEPITRYSGWRAPLPILMPRQ